MKVFLLHYTVHGEGKGKKILAFITLAAGYLCGPAGNRNKINAFHAPSVTLETTSAYLDDILHPSMVKGRGRKQYIDLQYYVYVLPASSFHQD